MVVCACGDKDFLVPELCYAKRFSLTDKFSSIN